jgi:RPA family protein
MMGIEVSGPTAMFCDNESVVKNSTRPESTLKNKHNAIAYHRMQEAQAARMSLVQSNRQTYSRKAY